jgi:hypothetical protein
MYLLYCDESCHLPNDGIDIMVLGTVYCRDKYKEQIFKDIRKIKEKHKLSPYFEVKWTKVSPAKIELYIELIEYFFENDNLFFRGLVAKGKNSLDHNKFNDGSYNSWYYKMYFNLMDKIIYPDEHYKIYVDIKDTIGGKSISKLHNVLCNNIYDFKEEVIDSVNQIHSHESEIMQLADLINGALAYFHRGLYSNDEKKVKSKLVNMIKLKTGLSLETSSNRYEKKFNLFVWSPRGGY